MEQPVVGDAGPLAPLQAGRDRDRLLGGVLDVDLEVVLEVLAHAGRVVHDVDAEAAEQRLVTDAGELEQLRGVDRAAAEDDLAGVDACALPAAAAVVDADRALALEPHLGGDREGLDVEVLAVPDRVQVGASGGEPAAAVQVAVEPREPLLPVAVDVVGERVAGLLRRRRRTPRRAGSRPARARAPAGRRRRASRRRRQAGLHALEVGQAVGVVPLLHPRLGRPALVVHRVAALEDHPVDARGAAEDLAAGVHDPAAVQVRLGVGLVAPVVEAAADRERQRRGHVDERVDLPVGVPGLEDQDAGAAVRREPVGQRAARPTRHPR